jgi:hypothetical protein
VVQDAQSRFYLRYYRNNENVGVANNFQTVTKLARGEYCWIIGDDDMVVKGKLPKLVKVIQANLDLDYFFVNYFNKSFEERDRLILEKDSFYAPEKSECMRQDLSERRLDKWDDLLDIEPADNYQPHIFTYIGSHVFRRSIWLENAQAINTPKGKYLESFDTAFPHVKILARAMVGKGPVYYLGDPAILAGWGGQEWMPNVAPLVLAYLPEAVHIYKKLGVKYATISRLQKILLNKYYSQMIINLVIERNHPGREIFSFRKFLWINRNHPTKTARLLAAVISKWICSRFTWLHARTYVWIPKPIRATLKTALKKMHILKI